MKTTITNSTMAPAATETYASAYAKLNSIAEKLKGAGAMADLETLVLDLREARAAHAFCKSRLDAIRREVDAEVEAAAEVTQ